MTDKLPRGQNAIPTFPRFGLFQFARRFPVDVNPARIDILGEVRESITLSDELQSLQRVEQYSDFHCVTTWSFRSIKWSGYRFREFYEQIVVPRAVPNENATILLVKGRDGARTTLLLEDALKDDVLLADRMNGTALTEEHGGRLRLVAPSQYGYKSVKFIYQIEFCRDYSTFRPSALRFMDHPRARVAFEERGKWLPGWLLRFLYRPLIGPTIRRFEKALDEHKQSQG